MWDIKAIWRQSLGFLYFLTCTSKSVSMENWYFKPARLEASLLDTVNQLKILSPGTVPHRICVVYAFCLLYAIFILSCFKVHFVCHIFKNYGVFCSFSSKHMISTSLFESCNFILFQCDLVSFYFHCSSKSSFFF